MNALSRSLVTIVVAASSMTHSASGEDWGVVIVLVEAHAVEGRVGDVIAGFKTSQAACKTWDGCISFEITQDCEDANHITIVERWESVAQHKTEVEKVVASENFQAFREMLEADLAFRYVIPL